ncbi:hypothetical protein T11_10495, partial [Trichinella zimbabwensis]
LYAGDLVVVCSLIKTSIALGLRVVSSTITKLCFPIIISTASLSLLNNIPTMMMVMNRRLFSMLVLLGVVMLAYPGVSELQAPMLENLYDLSSSWPGMNMKSLNIYPKDGSYDSNVVPSQPWTIIDRRSVPFFGVRGKKVPFFGARGKRLLRPVVGAGEDERYKKLSSMDFFGPRG